MASANSDHYNLQKSDRARTSLQATPNISDGSIQYAIIPVSFAGTESANDTVNLCQLPPGVIPVPALSYVQVTTDPGTTLTVDIGTTLDPDGWCDGANVAAVGVVNCCSAAIPAFANAGLNSGLAADSGADDGLVTAIATWATVGGNSAATLVFHLAYKLPR